MSEVPHPPSPSMERGQRMQQTVREKPWRRLLQQGSGAVRIRTAALMSMGLMAVAGYHVASEQGPHPQQDRVTYAQNTPNIIAQEPTEAQNPSLAVLGSIDAFTAHADISQPRRTVTVTGDPSQETLNQVNQADQTSVKFITQKDGNPNPLLAVHIDKNDLGGSQGVAIAVDGYVKVVMSVDEIKAIQAKQPNGNEVILTDNKLNGQDYQNVFVVNGLPSQKEKDTNITVYYVRSGITKTGDGKNGLRNDYIAPRFVTFSDVIRPPASS